MTSQRHRDIRRVLVDAGVPIERADQVAGALDAELPDAEPVVDPVREFAKHLFTVPDDD